MTVIEGPHGCVIRDPLLIVWCSRAKNDGTERTCFLRPIGSFRFGGKGVDKYQLCLVGIELVRPKIPEDMLHIMEPKREEEIPT